jgi:two-component system cell cycle sensor histidine kinase/response regulator CckA
MLNYGIGDKVVCVDDKFPPDIGKLYDALPVKDSTYVVRDIRLESLTFDAAAAALQPAAAPGHYIHLTIQDNGSGIPIEILPHIFEPFFTTKDVGKGTGLGLATVHGIVLQHHGWITVDSQRGVGTQFHIHLPRLADTKPLQAGEAAAPPVRGGSETILLVEDETTLRNLATRTLKRYGYHVLQAASGPATLELWRQHHHAVDLLLTDIIMPEGMSGRQLAEQLHAEKPDLKIIYMSGYPGEVAGRGLELREGDSFLQKPFLPARLAQIVRDCLDTPPKP